VTAEEADQILVERPRPGVVLATLNRPDKLNALTFEMFGRLRVLCDELAGDPDARVLVLTGAGRGFCSGLDLADAGTLAAMSAQEMLRGQEGWAAGIAAIRLLPLPVIAAVNGPAAGAGFALALAADMRLASPSARFNAAFVRIGLTGGDVGVSWMLPRIVGLGHASEILLTGRMLDAEYAHRIGLANAIVDDEQGLLDAAYGLAEKIAQNSPFGVRLTKQVLQTNVDAPSLQAAIELENRNQVLATRTADMIEALAAFREKRPPNFTGR
jgi:enoyl-CoA hydratase/carnithine racemase